MPRRKKTPNPFAFNQGSLTRVDRAISATKSPGSYPTERRFGSQISETIGEQYKRQSRWQRWRAGYELYAQGLYWDYGTSTVDLLPDTSDEVRIRLKLYGFMVSDGDRAQQLHYVLYREPESYSTLGVVDSIVEEGTLLRLNLTEGSSQLRRLIGDRITDGGCSARVVDVRSERNIPLLISNSEGNLPLDIHFIIPAGDALDAFLLPLASEQDLLGQPIFGNPNLFVVEQDNPTLFDQNPVFRLALDVIYNPRSFAIERLPGDIVSLDGSFALEGDMLFPQAPLLPFLDAGNPLASLSPYVDRVNAVTGAMTITEASIEPNGDLKLRSRVTPQVVELETTFEGISLLVDPLSAFRVLPDGSTTQVSCTFATGVSLRAAPLFCCTCPDHSQVVFRAPTAQNRQSRYPLPVASARNRYDQFDETAGLYSTWRKEGYDPRDRYCKHIYAVLFDNRLKPQEPSDYMGEAENRQFEKNLAKKMAEMRQRMMFVNWGQGYSQLEITYLLAQGVGLDVAEFASILPVNQGGQGTGSVRVEEGRIQVNNGFSFVDLFG